VILEPPDPRRAPCRARARTSPIPRPPRGRASAARSRHEHELTRRPGRALPSRVAVRQLVAFDTQSLRPGLKRLCNKSSTGLCTPWPNRAVIEPLLQWIDARDRVVEPCLCSGFSACGGRRRGARRTASRGARRRAERGSRGGADTAGRAPPGRAALGVSADRPLERRPGLKGWVAYPLKKLLRPLLRWYVEPLAPSSGCSTTSC
jgi:hypothetical protein